MIIPGEFKVQHFHYLSVLTFVEPKRRREFSKDSDVLQVSVFARIKDVAPVQAILSQGSGVHWLMADSFDVKFLSVLDTSNL
jgi:hypothetical protein